MDLASFDPRDPAVPRSRRLGLAAAQSYRDQYGHLAAPATTPVGAWRAEQRHLATKNTLDAARADALTRLAPDWHLFPTARTGTASTTCCAPTSPPAPTRPPFTRDTLLAGVKIGFWLHRQLDSIAG
ncbi:helicase associated domain-containing protein [Streptomyces capillispiralis]|uniref:helicase associated domain-containing protein n=1 Tax=Streptomyces capillispiralis TaxID=68182 RepID=UPI00368F8E41